MCGQNYNMHILVGLLGAVLSISGVLGYGKFQEYSQTFGALPLIQSAQLAASPSNGECLFSDGTANYWDTCSGGPGGGLSSYDAWTHPASGISATTSGMVFNSASSTFVGQLRAGHFFGNITGQSSTSLALAANGSNCSAGNFPLGVDASGAVESCTDAWTEAENTAAAYAAQATTLTIAGTAQQITSSAGAQSLAANRTWTLSLPSYVLFPGDIRATNSTTTNATTTSLAVTNLNSASCDVKASTAGVLSCGTDAGGLSDYDAWTHPAAGISATTSQIIISASSTIGDGTYGLTNNGNATTTGRLYVGPSNIATGVNGPLSSGPGFGNLTMACNGCGGTGGNILSIANFGSAVGAGINTFSARGTAASPSATQASDVLYFMGGRGFGTTAWDAGSKAAIQFVASQAHTDTANGTYITLETTPNNSTTRAEHLRVDQSGFIGIGTTTPYAKLSVVGSSGVVAGKYTATSTGTINESVFQNVTMTNATATNATSTASSITHATISTTLSLFGSVYTTLAGLGNALVNAVTAVTPTGTWDFGGATSIEIVNGASPTIDAIGEIGIDTTSNLLLYGTSTNSGGPAVVTPFNTIGFTYSTSSWTGTTTVYLPMDFQSFDIQQAYCRTDAGTVAVSVSDSSNRMDLIPTASTTINLFKYSSTNSNFTAGEKIEVDIGAPASSPKKIQCSFKKVYVRD